MNVLITGGGGFIGYEAAKFFRARGDEVTLIDINPDPIKWAEAQTLGMKVFKDTIHNLVAKKEYANLEFDAIIHAAAQTTMTKSVINPLNDFYHNALGTFHVCEYARTKKAHLIFTSTNKVYGTNVNKVSVTDKGTRWDFAGKDVSIEETFPIDNTGHGPYGCSKLAADIYVQDYHDTFGLNTTVFRQSCIYGASQRGTEDQGWVYHIAKQAYNGSPINIYGDGKQLRDILYVDDLINAFDIALEKKISGVFNIGGGVGNTLSVLELISKYPAKSKIEYHPWRTADQKVYISNIAKAKRIMNWEPKISIDEGIKRLTEAF